MTLSEKEQTEVRKANRLINEKSPYLLQHAYNPVDWYPWGEEAFEKAKRENKPIFLSIGYSTCHWCHVMEGESFEDEEVAKVLNDNYVAIKVDREERPDIDSIYMNFCQAYTGSGGWPLNIVTTPDRKPFFAGTYFPKKSRFGIKGIIEILNSINQLWTEDNKRVLQSSENLLNYMRNHSSNIEEGNLSREVIDKAVDELKEHFEGQYGGFGKEPKFPTTHYILFLLRYYEKNKDEEVLRIIDKTLEGMYKGGIFDHVGFGFARYATDIRWLLPHFEKMLYDNALLAMAYAEAYKLTGKELYKKVADNIFTYVLRDMVSSEGGFYSAEDADSEGVEGKFYLWSLEEIENILNEEEFSLYTRLYDITSDGNFEGANIPNLIDTDLKELSPYREQLETIRKKLFNYRDERIHPHKDDKILTSWNGLMITSLALGGRLLDNKEYIEFSEKALNFILNNLIDEKGRLYTRYRDKHRAHKGIIDDYSFLIWAIIECYESTFKIEYLESAIELSNEMIELFWDEENGGFFLYGSDDEELIVRPKEIYDGAIPSGNGVASLALLKLYYITGKDKYIDIVDKNFKVFGGKIKENPMYYLFSVIAYMYREYSVREITIVGDKKEEIDSILKEINNKYNPFTLVTLRGKESNMILDSKEMIDNKTTIYVCENYNCKTPITDINELKNILNN
ncbi:thioredoxin domain-containing protein [Clostridium sp. Marseille-Q7071]